jgi:hypothetical protein
MNVLRFPFALALLVGSLFADEPTTTAKIEIPTTISRGTTHALVICGHPGDAEHIQLFAETIDKLHTGLTATLKIDPANVVILHGFESDDESILRPKAPVRSPATKEAIASAVTELRTKLQPEDSLWVVVIGHAYFEGRLSFLNLPGPDIQQDEFGRLFKDLQSREQVFFITTPASGYYLKTLTAPGRILITATEADLEVNETLFPHALAEELNPTPEAPLFDADKDGRISLFDLYIAVTKNTARRYISESLIATEHALLDDNSDGRATEVQRDYLTEEEGGRRNRKSPTPPKPNQDGAQSILLSLPIPVIEPPPPAEREKPAESTTTETAGS